MKIKKILLHPITILISMGVGVFLGYYFPQFGSSAGNLGELYLNCLQMCVFPLITAAVFNSVLSLCSNLHQSLGFLRNFICCCFLGMLGSVLFGLATGIITALGSEIDIASQDVLGAFVNNQESASSDKFSFRNGFDFLHMIIPQNPFTAYAEGSGLKILFFSIVMGIAFSFGVKERVAILSNILSELFDACIRVLNFLILLLPLGLMFIFANQFSVITFEVIGALGKFLTVSIVAISFIIFINIIILKLASRKSLIETFRGTSNTLTMAFATSSGFVTMPQIIQDMENNFKVSNTGLRLVVPLSINMSPQGTCLSISLFGIFFAQMYHVNLEAHVLLIIIFGAMMISMAISGLPALVGISLISALLESFGVPRGVSSALLLAVFPILDPPLTMLNCIGSCTYAYLLGYKSADAKIALGQTALSIK